MAQRATDAIDDISPDEPDIDYLQQTFEGQEKVLAQLAKLDSSLGDDAAQVLHLLDTERDT